MNKGKYQFLMLNFELTKNPAFQLGFLLVLSLLERLGKLNPAEIVKPRCNFPIGHSSNSGDLMRPHNLKLKNGRMNEETYGSFDDGVVLGIDERIGNGRSNWRHYQA